MPAAVVPVRFTDGRAASARLALGALAGCALLATVDPDAGGPYPVCPTAALLGLDCPACGTLRGLHALSRGRVAEALDHNLLLLVAVPLAALVWLRWAASALGRPAAPLAPPRWLLPAVIALAAAFAVLRNVPLASLAWLGSGA